MIFLPEWAIQFLNEQNCPHCKSKTYEEGVVGIGVRQKDFSKKEPEKGDFLLTFEYLCSGCSGNSVWIASPPVDNAGITDILKEISLINKELNNKESDSKISNKEVEEMKSFLRENIDYDDFLRYLGIITD